MSFCNKRKAEMRGPSEQTSVGAVPTSPRRPGRDGASASAWRGVGRGYML